MAEPDKDLSRWKSFSQTDALAKLLIEKGPITLVSGIKHGNIVETG
jgi:hypothetical protein